MEASTQVIERETPAPEIAPALSILIVTWNSERWIDRCLQSIPAACEGVPREVVLWDNSKDNIGFAAAVNRAAASSHGEFVFLLNPDCELGSKSVTLLVDFLRTHPDVAAAAPLLEDESGNSQREFQLRRFPTLSTFVVDILAIDKIWPANPVTSAYRYRDLDLSRPQLVEQPAAAALVIRRDVLDEIGPLDEQFFPAWFEDVDYCRRLAAAGKEIWVVPAAQARHFGGASLEHVPFDRFIDLWYRNMWRYARKWFSRSQQEALRWIVMLGMLLRLPAAAIGIAHREVGRWNAVRAYARVLGKAFKRWGDSSQSS
ncbi:MAG TPA: glycosyltransferase family 2 protein [Thermoanaerobaculia bacterium]|nr:glycosyltransferase family 2 protein [Thermoanaerobaculia bacterium]